MKIATYRVGGERRVGLVDDQRQTVSQFDLTQAESLHGVLALIDLPTLSIKSWSKVSKQESDNEVAPIIATAIGRS